MSRHSTRAPARPPSGGLQRRIAGIASSRLPLATWVLLVVVGTFMLVCAMVPTGPEWFGITGSLIVGPAYAWALAARTGGRGGRHDPARPLTRAAVGLTAIFLVVFAVNTVTSPRSWLSGASDPDWIPWVSDDWMSAVWDGV